MSTDAASQTAEGEQPNQAGLTPPYHWGLPPSTASISNLRASQQYSPGAAVLGFPFAAAASSGGAGGSDAVAYHDQTQGGQMLPYYTQQPPGSPGGHLEVSHHVHGRVELVIAAGGIAGVNLSSSGAAPASAAAAGGGGEAGGPAGLAPSASRGGSGPGSSPGYPQQPQQQHQGQGVWMHGAAAASNGPGAGLHFEPSLWFAHSNATSRASSPELRMQVPQATSENSQSAPGSLQPPVHQQHQQQQKQQSVLLQEQVQEQQQVIAAPTPPAVVWEVPWHEGDTLQQQEEQHQQSQPGTLQLPGTASERYGVQGWAGAEKDGEGQLQIAADDGYSQAGDLRVRRRWEGVSTDGTASRIAEQGGLGSGSTGGDMQGLVAECSVASSKGNNAMQPPGLSAEGSSGSNVGNTLEAIRSVSSRVSTLLESLSRQASQRGRASSSSSGPGEGGVVGSVPANGASWVGNTIAGVEAAATADDGGVAEVEGALAPEPGDQILGREVLHLSSVEEDAGWPGVGEQHAGAGVIAPELVPSVRAAPPSSPRSLGSSPSRQGSRSSSSPLPASERSSFNRGNTIQAPWVGDYEAGVVQEAAVIAESGSSTINSPRLQQQGSKSQEGNWSSGVSGSPRNSLYHRAMTEAAAAVGATLLIGHDHGGDNSGVIPAAAAPASGAAVALSADSAVYGMPIPSTSQASPSRQESRRSNKLSNSTHYAELPPGAAQAVAEEAAGGETYGGPVAGPSWVSADEADRVVQRDYLEGMRAVEVGGAWADGDEPVKEQGQGGSQGQIGEQPWEQLRRTQEQLEQLQQQWQQAKIQLEEFHGQREQQQQQQGVGLGQDQVQQEWERELAYSMQQQEALSGGHSPSSSRGEAAAAAVVAPAIEALSGHGSIRSSYSRALVSAGALGSGYSMDIMEDATPLVASPLPAAAADSGGTAAGDCSANANGSGNNSRGGVQVFPDDPNAAALAAIQSISERMRSFQQSFQQQQAQEAVGPWQEITEVQQQPEEYRHARHNNPGQQQGGQHHHHHQQQRDPLQMGHWQQQQRMPSAVEALDQLDRSFNGLEVHRYQDESTSWQRVGQIGLEGDVVSVSEQDGHRQVEHEQQHLVKLPWQEEQQQQADWQWQQGSAHNQHQEQLYLQQDCSGGVESTTSSTSTTAAADAAGMAVTSVIDTAASVPAAAAVVSSSPPSSPGRRKGSRSRLIRCSSPEPNAATAALQDPSCLDLNTPQPELEALGMTATGMGASGGFGEGPAALGSGVQQPSSVGSHGSGAFSLQGGAIVDQGEKQAAAMHPALAAAAAQVLSRVSSQVKRAAQQQQQQQQREQEQQSSAYVDSSSMAASNAEAAGCVHDLRVPSIAVQPQVVLQNIAEVLDAAQAGFAAGNSMKSKATNPVQDLSGGEVEASEVTAPMALAELVGKVAIAQQQLSELTSCSQGSKGASGGQQQLQVLEEAAAQLQQVQKALQGPLRGPSMEKEGSLGPDHSSSNRKEGGSGTGVCGSSSVNNAPGPCQAAVARALQSSSSSSGGGSSSNAGSSQESGHISFLGKLGMIKGAPNADVEGTSGSRSSTFGDGSRSISQASTRGQSFSQVDAALKKLGSLREALGQLGTTSSSGVSSSRPGSVLSSRHTSRQASQRSGSAVGPTAAATAAAGGGEGNSENRGGDDGTAANHQAAVVEAEGVRPEYSVGSIGHGVAESTQGEAFPWGRSSSSWALGVCPLQPSAAGPGDAAPASVGVGGETSADEGELGGSITLRVREHANRVNGEVRDGRESMGADFTAASSGLAGAVPAAVPAAAETLPDALLELLASATSTPLRQSIATAPDEFVDIQAGRAEAAGSVAAVPLRSATGSASGQAAGEGVSETGAAGAVGAPDGVVVYASDDEDEAGFWAVMARTTPLGKGEQGLRQGFDNMGPAAAGAAASDGEQLEAEGPRPAALWQDEVADSQEQQPAAAAEATSGPQLVCLGSSRRSEFDASGPGTSQGVAPAATAAAVNAGGCSDTGLLASEGGVWPGDENQHQHWFQQQQQQQEWHGGSELHVDGGLGGRWGQGQEEGLSPQSLPLLASAGNHSISLGVSTTDADAMETGVAQQAASAAVATGLDGAEVLTSTWEVGRGSRAFEMPWQVVGEWSSVSSVAGSCVMEARAAFGSQQSHAVTTGPVAAEAAAAVTQSLPMGRAPGGVSVTAAWEGAAARTSFNQHTAAGPNLLSGAETAQQAAAGTAGEGVGEGLEVIGSAAPNSVNSVACSTVADGLLACVEDSSLLLALSAKLEHLAQRFGNGSSRLGEEGMAEGLLEEVSMSF